VRAAAFICKMVSLHWRDGMLRAMAVIITRFPVVMTSLRIQPATMRKCLRCGQQANSQEYPEQLASLPCASCRCQPCMSHVVSILVE